MTAAQPIDDFHVGDIVRGRHTGGKLVVRAEGTWLARFYDLVSCPHAHVRPEDCQTPRGPWGSCIQALALGWIHPTDLCAPCTQTFMRALGAVVPNLDWHPNYVARAAGSREGVAQ